MSSQGSKLVPFMRSISGGTSCRRITDIEFGVRGEAYVFFDHSFVRCSFAQHVESTLSLEAGQCHFHLETLTLFLKPS